MSVHSFDIRQNVEENEAAERKRISLSPEEKKQKMIEDFRRKPPKKFSDEKDASVHPSYSKLDFPYEMKCKLRYIQKRALYEEQFQQEVSQLMSQQGSAYDAARFHRHLAITSLWPPYHNHAEIKFTGEKIFRLSKQKRKRLNYLMTNDIT